MSTFFTINGKRAAAGRITIPTYGPWVADIDLAATDTIDSVVTLVIGDLTLKGTIIRSASFAGAQSLRIVAGAAGWRKTIKAKGYSHIVGVKLSAVLKDAARDVGETIAVSSDKSIGKYYARRAGKAERVLRSFLDGRWWIDTDGVTKTASRVSTSIKSSFSVISRKCSTGRFEIATEVLADWMPGRKFKALTVTDEQTISSVTISSSNDGKLRLDVLTSETAEDRLKKEMVAIIQDELSLLNYSSTWDYNVSANPLSPGLVSTLDLISKSPVMPDLAKVPLALELGTVAAPAAGTTCRVRFVNGDPTKPEVVRLGATTEHLMTTEACALLIFNTLAAWCAAAGGGPLLAAVLQPLILPSIILGLTAQGAPGPPGLLAQTIAATALAAAMAPGTTPSQTSQPFNALIDSFATGKTLNVSGFFPGVGIPHGD